MGTVASKVIRKLLSPSDLASYLRYKLVHGNEYLYFDAVDRAPALGAAFHRLAPGRVDFATPIFLASLRRSGSTLFFRIMNTHPDLFLYNERFPGDRMNGRGKPTSKNIWSVDDPAVFLALVARYVGPTVRLRYRRWGVKLSLEVAHPHPGSLAVENLRSLARAFPEARFLGLVRDPRDFVLSAIKRMGHDVAWWAGEYGVMADLFDEMSGRYPDRFLVTRYEDLVTDPGSVTRTCCEFAGLRYVPAMLEPSNWSSKGPPVYDKSGIQAQTAKWQRAAGEDRAIVERAQRACFPAASRFGYRVDG